MDQAPLDEVRPAKVPLVVKVARGLLSQLDQGPLSQRRYPKPCGERECEPKGHETSHQCPQSVALPLGERLAGEPKPQEGGEDQRRDIVGQHKCSIAGRQQSDVFRCWPLTKLEQGPHNEGIERHRVEFGERIAAHIDVYYVKGGKGVGTRGQQCSIAARSDPARQNVHAAARKEKAECLRELYAPQYAKACPVEQRSNIIGKGRVEVEGGISKPVGSVGHPARRERAAAEIRGELMNTLQEERGIPSGARVDDAGASQEGERRHQGQGERQEKMNIYVSGAPLPLSVGILLEHCFPDYQGSQAGSQNPQSDGDNQGDRRYQNAADPVEPLAESAGGLVSWWLQCRCGGCRRRRD